MSRAATKWMCGIYGKTIYWDELFTYMSNKAVVHYTCFRDKAIKTAKVDEKQIKAVLDSLEDELRLITLYKQRLNLVSNNKEIKKLMEQAEKDAEKNSALLTRAVEKISGVLE